MRRRPTVPRPGPAANRAQLAAAFWSSVLSVVLSSFQPPESRSRVIGSLPRSTARNLVLQVVVVPFLPVAQGAPRATHQPRYEGNHWRAVRGQLDERFEQTGRGGQALDEVRRCHLDDSQLQGRPRLAAQMAEIHGRFGLFDLRRCTPLAHLTPPRIGRAWSSPARNQTARRLSASGSPPIELSMSTGTKMTPAVPHSPHATGARARST